MIENKKYLYLGNYPNQRGYDPNIPIGYNKWDELESWGDEDDEEYGEDDEDWRNFPNEDYD